MQTGQTREHSPDGRRLRADEWLLLAYIVALPLMRPLSIRLSGMDIPAADFLFVAVAVCWLAALLRRTVVVRRSWFYLPLGAYLAALAVSTSASVDPLRSAVKLVGEVYLVAIAVVAYNLIGSPRYLRMVFNAWLVGTAVTVGLSLVGVALFYVGFRTRSLNLVLHDYGTLPPGNYPRINGLFFYPSMLCNYLGISLMLALGMRAASWLDAMRLRLLVFGICATNLFTLTPGLGGTFLSAGAWAYWRMKDPKRRLFGRLLLLCGATAALAFLLAASINLFAYRSAGFIVPPLHGDIEPSHRAHVWQMALETFRQHPLVGRGVGAEVANYHFQPASGLRQHLTDAHNVWLSIAGQEGLFGLLAFAAIVAFLLKDLRPHDSGSTDASVPAASIIKTALTLAIVDALLFQGLVGAFEDSRHLWALFGMLAAVKEGAGGDSRLTPGEQSA